MADPLRYEAEIEAALPKRDDAKTAAWREAIAAVEGLAKEATAKAGAVAKMQGAADKLRQLEENLKYGPKTHADAKEELQRAKAMGEEDPEKEKELADAEKFLTNRQKEIDQLQGGIEKARIAVKEAQAGLPAASPSLAAVPLAQVRNRLEFHEAPSRHAESLSGMPFERQKNGGLPCGRPPWNGLVCAVLTGSPP